MLDDLISDLLSIDSVSPHDKGCQTLLKEKLLELGFDVQHLDFSDVKNLWAKRGNQAKTLLFVGHTDVVPPGPLEPWKYPPFTPTIDDGKLYARGTADMKVAIACMIEACRRFLQDNPEPAFNLAFLMTSCEEADTIYGTEKALQQLINIEGEKIDWCIVGEPSAEKTLGDAIKIGRRGSLNGNLTIYGKQGHIAYPHLAENPIHLASKFLQEITQIIWDKGTEYFDPTSFQISNIHSGTGVTNVIPGDINIIFNFRYSPASSAEALQKTVEDLSKKHHLRYDLEWNHSAKPFISKPRKLHDALQKSITHIIGQPAKVSTTGGTSDGRFIAPLGIETIECGFPNGTIHQIDEYILVEDIEQLTRIYHEMLQFLENDHF